MLSLQGCKSGTACKLRGIYLPFAQARPWESWRMLEMGRSLPQWWKGTVFAASPAALEPVLPLPALGSLTCCAGSRARPWSATALSTMD